MTRKRALPAGVWALGLVSLFMDTSSELVHSLLPIFMVTTLGASVAAIGVIEGVAEGTVALTKIFSGTLSDVFGARKLLAGIGYGIAALTKPIFPLAATIGWVFAARVVDRIGKGIRGAPRDALVADLTPPELRGAAYGLRQSLDAVGALAGPLAAVGLMIWFAGDVRTALWFAVAPAFVAVAVLVFAVHDAAPSSTRAARPVRLALAGAARLSRAFWVVVALGALFTLARFSEAFLILRGHDLGLGPGQAPLVLVAMNVVYGASAYPVGAAADRMSHRTVLTWGLLILVAADVVLATAASPAAVLAGAGLWGLHMGFTQGLFAKLVADTAEAGLRGTAFGIFNLVTGAAMIVASVLAGALWSEFGARAAFLSSAAFAALSALGLATRRWS